MKALLMSLFLLTPRSTIRELPKEIDEMRAVIERQDERIDKLESELNELKNLIK